MTETYDAGRGVYLILRNGNNETLFLHRNGTEYLDGMHMLPGGRIDEHERPTLATARETLEEIGITIEPEKLVFAHFMYRGAHDESGDRVDIFFEASEWKGDPVICEPHKCDRLDWLPMHDLPDSVPEYVRVAIGHYLAGEDYSEFDW